MNRKKKLSQQDLRELGATPGFVATRYGPDGRAEVRRLISESRNRPDARRNP